MKYQSFTGQFTQMAKALPDLEVSCSAPYGGNKLTLQRLISRIHAGSVKQTDFVKVVHVRHTSHS